MGGDTGSAGADRWEGTNRVVRQGWRNFDGESMSEMASTTRDPATQTEDTPSVDLASTELQQPTQSDESLSLDVIFEALKNERRRLVLQYLYSSNGTLELRDIAERIAADENEKSRAEITYDERKRVYVALYQCHLPKLDDMGVIAFDKSRGTLEESSEAAALKPYLEQRAPFRPWYVYYGAIIGTGIVALLTQLVAGILTATTAQLTLITVLIAVTVCAILHAQSARESEH